MLYTNAIIILSSIIHFMPNVEAKSHNGTCWVHRRPNIPEIKPFKIPFKIHFKLPSKDWQHFQIKVDDQLGPVADLEFKKESNYVAFSGSLWNATEGQRISVPLAWFNDTSRLTFKRNATSLNLRNVNKKDISIVFHNVKDVENVTTGNITCSAYETQLTTTTEETTKPDQDQYTDDVTSPANLEAKITQPSQATDEISEDTSCLSQDLSTTLEPETSETPPYTGKEPKSYVKIFQMKIVIVSLLLVILSLAAGALTYICKLKMQITTLENKGPTKTCKPTEEEQQVGHVSLQLADEISADNVEESITPFNKSPQIQPQKAKVVFLTAKPKRAKGKLASDMRSVENLMADLSGQSSIRLSLQ